MGRRKFRLSTRKNLERKKFQKCSAISHKAITCNKPEPDVRELVVQLPLRAYLSAAAPSFHVLCDRMRDSEIICCNGWTCTGISNNVLQKSFSSYSVTVTIQPDYCFIVEIGGHWLDKCPSITTTTITSLDLLITVLRIFDNSLFLIMTNSLSQFVIENDVTVPGKVSLQTRVLPANGVLMR